MTTMRRTMLAVIAWSLVLAVILDGDVARAELRLSEALSAPASDWDGDGTVDYKGDEWVEILNTGPAVEDLDGVFLKDATGDAYHYGFHGTLAAGEVLVVYGSDAVQWQADNGAGSSGLSLNNSGDGLELWRDIAEPRIFQALDMLPIPSHAAAADRSIGWSTATSSWVLHDGLNPYSGQALPGPTGCEPSPGVRNHCDGLVPVEASSWGTLKARFPQRP